MSVRSELEAIRDQDPDGILRVEIAEQWAQDHPESALYQALEWDDEIAARQHRLAQIRRLIKVHIVTLDNRPQMISLSIDRINVGGYRQVEVVMRDKQLRVVAMADALKELERIQAKYAWLQELASVWEALENVQAKKRGRGRPRKEEDERPRA